MRVEAELDHTAMVTEGRRLEATSIERLRQAERQGACTDEELRAARDLVLELSRRQDRLATLQHASEGERWHAFALVVTLARRLDEGLAGCSPSPRP
ncbi:MAG: hypothetical protein ACFCGT_17750 [Sandaracinaceae bacterium]